MYTKISDGIYCIARALFLILLAALIMGRPVFAAEQKKGQPAAPETETVQTEAETVPETEAPRQGLVRGADRKLYYYENGKKIRRTLKKVKDHTYYFGKRGAAVTEKWKKIGKDKYYFGKNGRAYQGSRKIGDTYYVFKKSGKLAVGEDRHVVRYEDKKYYVSKRGKAVSGWHIYKKRVLYAMKSGRMAADRKVSYIRFNSKGYAQNRWQAMSKIYASDFIKDHTSSSMSRREKLRKCFYYLLGHRRYIAHYVSDRRAYKTNTWQYRAACDMLCDRRLEGNCRNFAAAFAAIAKELGFKPYVWSMRIHSVVKIDDKYYDSLRGIGHYAGERLPSYTNAKKFKF